MADSPNASVPRGKPEESYSLPDQVDLRPMFLPIKDQGKRGTCLAFAVTAGHEHARIVPTSVLGDLSEEALYWRSKQVDGDYSPGTSFASAATALKNWGQPEEDAWPYDAARNDADASYQPPVGAVAPDICFSASLLPLATSTSAFKQQLTQGRAVALGLLLWPAFFNPIQGHISLPSNGETLLDGHAVLIVGYVDSQAGVSDAPVESSGYLIIRNSWGTEWGDEGYGYLPYEFFERYFVLVYTVYPDLVEEVVS